MKNQKEKFFKVFLEPLPEEFIGVVEGENKEIGEDNVFNENKKFTVNKGSLHNQRGYVLYPVTKKEYERTKKYCQSI